MNKKQRKKLTEQKVKIESAHDILEGVREEIEEIFGEEQDKFDNLPEGLQESGLGEALQEIASMLEDIASNLDDASSQLSGILDSIDEVLDY
jgi:uncharacterized phage infection (PIP) family protein YhgE